MLIHVIQFSAGLRRHYDRQPAGQGHQWWSEEESDHRSASLHQFDITLSEPFMRNPIDRLCIMCRSSFFSPSALTQVCITRITAPTVVSLISPCTLHL